MSCHNRKFLLSAVLIIFIVGGFFVWQSNVAKATDVVPAPAENLSPAQELQEADYKSKASAQNNNTITVNNANKNNNPADWDLYIPVVFHIVGGLLFMILKFLNGMVWLGANLADKILGITSFTSATVVTIGWGITRDLANMFFALILLVMSISTILQIEGFTYKQILKRLIIAALLINFSLMFAGIIIDFAQVMTSFFLTAGAGEAGISANLTNGLKIVQVFNFSDVDRSIFQKVSGAIWGPSLKMIIEQIMAVILFTAAAFSFFAMSFFLIARIVWIWLLLIGAPLAWIAFIVPNAPGELGGLWNRWWKEFLNWVFFAPIYSFFLYLALTIANIQNGLGLNNASNELGAWGKMGTANTLPLQSKFFEAPETILKYIVIIMILLGGLTAARKMGITGANTAMGLVDKAGNWMKNKAWDYSKRPGQWAYDSLANKAAQGTGKMFSAIGFKKFGNRLTAQGVQMELEPAERERQKDYAKRLGFMSDKDLLYETNNAYGIKKLLAVRQAKERGLLEKGLPTAFDDTPEGKNNYSQEAKNFKEDLYSDEEKKDPDRNSKYNTAKNGHAKYIEDKNKYDESEENQEKTKESKERVNQALSVLNSYGLKDDKGKTKEGRDLEDVRFDAIADDTEREKVIRRSKENGNIEKIKPIVFNDPKAVASFVKELSPPEQNEVYKKLGKQTKKALEEGLRKSFAELQGLTGGQLAEELKKRNAFADITGKVHTAFANKNGMLDNEGKRQLAKYVSTMTAAKLAELRHPGSEHDIGFVARYASSDLINSVGREKSINTTQKAAFYNGAQGTVKSAGGGNINIGKNENPGALNAFEAPGWKTFSEPKNKADDKFTQNDIATA
ncbi:MAG: hypothetical protein PHT44_01505 [Candidatus Portnoybacteria bacterium]|nr:hypothetical protein [Candidatus Portnoybacteria bacterium]MDD4982729.1 hypothetical protein [Candidatus Portnoybacteria bacterium]